MNSKKPTEACKTCNGTGSYQGVDCPRCFGEGKEKPKQKQEKSAREVSIPLGEKPAHPKMNGHLISRIL